MKAKYILSILGQNTWLYKPCNFCFVCSLIWSEVILIYFLFFIKTSFLFYLFLFCIFNLFHKQYLNADSYSATSFLVLFSYLAILLSGECWKSSSFSTNVVFECLRVIFGKGVMGKGDRNLLNLFSFCPFFFSSKIFHIIVNIVKFHVTLRTVQDTLKNNNVYSSP